MSSSTEFRPKKRKRSSKETRTPFPRMIEDDKRLVWGRGRGGRLLQVIFLLDEDDTVFIIHARPLTQKEKQRVSKDHGEMTKRTKPYFEMTAKELAKATTKFDKEFVIDESREASPKEKAQWQRAERETRPAQNRQGRACGFREH